MQENYITYLSSDHWKGISKNRMQIDGYTCQMCGCRGTSDNPLQVHHLSYKNYPDHEDVYKDLITLCQCCHRGIHTMMNRVTSPDGRHGWKDEQLPQIHVYTLDGIGRGMI